MLASFCASLTLHTLLFISMQACWRLMCWRIYAFSSIGQGVKKMQENSKWNQISYFNCLLNYCFNLITKANNCFLLIESQVLCFIQKVQDCYQTQRHIKSESPAASPKDIRAQMVRAHLSHCLVRHRLQSPRRPRLAPESPVMYICKDPHWQMHFSGPLHTLSHDI